MRRGIGFFIIVLTATLRSVAQDSPPADVKNERWNLFYQATSIGDEHGTFHAPYGGPLSLADYPEHDVSLTSTLFFSVRLEQNTVFVFNPEIAGGNMAAASRSCSCG